jgi:TolB protein
MKLKIMISCLILSLGLSQVAHARLHVEISGGGASGIPIAIMPFGIESSEFSDIIKADLKTSGLFKPQSEISGADDVVKGRVEKTSNGYKVSFELIDALKQQAGASGTSLLSMHFDQVQAHECRALAHHISDRIFEKLIGVRGIFSTRIAYVSVAEGSKGSVQTIEVADYDGYNPKALYRSHAPLLSPSWSPDGKKIAFVSYEKERQGINIVDVLTGRVERVSQYPGINSAPSWSPDGRTLALVLSKDGGPKIYTLNVDTRQLTKLTSGSGADTEPTWSVDGRSIAFTSDRGGKPQIYRVALGGGSVERLTFKGNYNSTPTLTPDNKNVVTLHRDEDGLFSIAVHSLQSGSVRVLTQSSLNESPRLAPNGMMVIYSALESGRRVLGAVTLDGRLKIRLPAQEGDVKEPAWSSFVSMK